MPMIGKTGAQRPRIQSEPLSELRSIALHARFFSEFDESANKPVSEQELEDLDILKDFTKLELVYIFEGGLTPRGSSEFHRLPEEEWRDSHRNVLRKIRAYWQEGKGNGNRVPKIEIASGPFWNPCG
jgi:hypothetical protein